MSSPSPKPDLAAANAIFHQAYVEARDRASNGVPILIVLGDDLILRRGARRQSWSFASPEFDDLKVAAHVIVTTRGLVGDGGEALTEVTRERLASLRDVLRGLNGSAMSPAMRKAIDACLHLLDDTLAGALGAPPSAASSRDLGALLEALTSEAARLRLVSLHQRVGELLGTLDVEARRALRVVVAGDHQARRRSHGMQYFGRRLAPFASGEPRVLYGESVSSEEEAFALVGTQLVDRALAATLFGDAGRMQEDLLGNATEEHLEAMELEAIA